MSRLNKWLKAKILSWLGLTTAEYRITLQEASDEQIRMLIKQITKELLKQIETANKNIIYTNGRVDDINTRTDNKLQDFEKTFKATVNVGVDFSPGRESMIDRSWAVVCINGKMQDIVQFYNLNDQEGRQVHEFLKHFSKANKTQDLPWGMKKFDFY